MLKIYLFYIISQLNYYEKKKSNYPHNLIDKKSPSAILILLDVLTLIKSLALISKCRNRVEFLSITTD